MKRVLHMLVVDKLHKRYQARKGEPAGGVFGVSFEVTKGELFTLLGPSGCGKTTTLRCIAGLEKPDSGRDRLDGQRCSTARRAAHSCRRTSATSAWCSSPTRSGRT